MKLGSNIWSFHRTVSAGKLTELEWVKKCRAELNLDGIEILDFPNRNPDGKYLKELKKTATDLHFDIYAVSCGSNFGKLTDREIQEEIVYVKKWIDIGYYLGTPIVRYFAGSPAKEELRSELWNNLVSATRECVSYAESKGIVLALENHNHNGFIQTSQDVFKLFNEINSLWLKLCLDTGNFKDLYPSIEATVSLAAFVHTKLYQLNVDGIEQRLDYERIFTILKSGNFNGYLSIEFEGEEDELTAVPRGVRYLRSMLQKQI